eukprot:Gregarina_sp_Pseudo_9__2152@NODE_2502_length_976_cov_172_747065_g2300_i0_p1_GENE_NODE_2502_length_976_cov_172_747065_g2300_i0NODE_2502_length_976_cov_172_747065_g2300_i0_p1_ORF_typecomplete_len138_score18_14UPF0139/PF03669_13/6_6e05_NODE_2502_length_976_cov_172_747065_g2300_i0450863
MFEDEPSQNEGKWEKIVNEDADLADDQSEGEEAEDDSCRDAGFLLDYKPPSLAGSSILCTIFTALPPLCTIASFMFKIPYLLYLCPAFVLSSWSLMRNGADKSQWITSLTCVGMSMFSHYMALQREAAARVAKADAS